MNIACLESQKICFNFIGGSCNKIGIILNKKRDKGFALPFLGNDKKSNPLTASELKKALVLLKSFRFDQLPGQALY